MALGTPRKGYLLLPNKLRKVLLAACDCRVGWPPWPWAADTNRGPAEEGRLFLLVAVGACTVGTVSDEGARLLLQEEEAETVELSDMRRPMAAAVAAAAAGAEAPTVPAV